MSESNEKLSDLRHSLAHLLAAAVMELWPDTKRTIGPAIADGFYFDFEFSTPISESDLPRIEKRMRKILPTWDGFERHELNAEEAKKEYPDNPYKHELIDEFTVDGSKVSFYKSGKYWDLCRGGHCDSAKEINSKAFKLTKVAGAYWRGDEKNTMLTRIYGVAFEKEQELEAHLTMLEEAKKRDHRKLGQELDLFTFSELVGPGLPLWTPRGTLLRNTLDNFVWSLRSERGYDQVEIPHITKKDLYEKSGHWDKFSEELFRIVTREGHEFAMKPMNCPHHTQIFARKQFSYKDMPQRYSNTTTCYRDEQTGELHGLSRVRSFTQDDAHVFCRHDQIKEEVLKIWDIINIFYSAVGFTELDVRLSLSDPDEPDKYLGDDSVWKKSEDTLRAVIKERGVEAVEEIGEAAFYGPKIDFMAKDSIGREWQVATIQLDLNMPESFDLYCIDEKGEHERVAMIHAAIMGSIERFLSVVIEHFAGAFPVWMSPVQVVFASVGDAHKKYAQQMADELGASGLRAEADVSDETVGKKIRNSARMKVPFMIVVGDNEVGGSDWQVRVRGEDEQKLMSKKAFVTHVEGMVNDKK